MNFREKPLSNDQNKREGNLRQQEMSFSRNEKETRKRKWRQQRRRGGNGPIGVGVVRVAADKYFKAGAAGREEWNERFLKKQSKNRLSLVFS